MTLYWVAIHHPDNYDPSSEDEAMTRAIDLLNDEMKLANVRKFAGGLRPVQEAVTLAADASGNITVSKGSYLATNEHVGGFWLLECKAMEEAEEWGRKAVIACRAPVEVRPFSNN